jgi:hypothetical protein
VVPTPTNATLNFVVQCADGATDRSITVCLEVRKPNEVSLRNDADRNDAIDGRMHLPPGSRAADIVARYASLLTRHGWVAGTDFVPTGNTLHFYGITALAAGAGDVQLAIYGATDSDLVPYRAMAPLPQ